MGRRSVADLFTDLGVGAGCLVVIAGLALLWIVKVVVEALVAVFSTPYPWIALALTGLGLAGYHAPRIWRAQRLEKLFFDTLAALREPDPAAPALLTSLRTLAPDQGDGHLLAAAYTAAWGRYEEAYAWLDHASKHKRTVGALSGGLELRFPGLPRAIYFNQSMTWETLQAIKAHLLTLAGRPAEALEDLVPQPEDPLNMLAVAEAREAVGEYARALSAWKQALSAAPNDPPLSRFFRYRIARLLEATGATATAAEEYDRLLSGGDYEDADQRRAAIHASVAAENLRREREAEEAQRRAHEAQVAHQARLEAEREEQERLAAEARLKAEEARAVARAQEEAARREWEQREREARREALRQREDAIVHETLAKIETAKGPAGRRAALHKGLSVLTQPEAQERLKLESSRIEVQAVLDKVDGLKTTAAKRRHLQAALDEIRADDVPDELQAQQIQWLEQALAELERS